MSSFIRYFLLILVCSFYCVADSSGQSLLSDRRKDGKKRTFLPMIYYANPDMFFAGIKWRFLQTRLKDDPYGIEQSLQARYSISQNSVSLLYDAGFKHLIGNWNLGINGYYDWLIWTNYFGLGNETVKQKPLSYYRLSTGEFAGSIGISRMFGNNHYIDLHAFVQGVEVMNNKPGTLAADSFVNNRTFYFEHHLYTGFSAGYAYQNVDDRITPQKGVMCYIGGRYTINTAEPGKNFLRGDGIVQVYLPLFSKFSLSLRAGSAAVAGTPEFYQYVSVGGPISIRGYVRDRYWGNIMFYNANELRYITDFHLIRGKIGVLALFDGGRVWVNNEQSNIYHTGYGGGLILAPLNKISGSVSYAVSPEGGIIQVHISRLLSFERQQQATGKQWK